MAKDPAFLFYPNDYIGGTMGMTFEEKGAYVDLLMLQFNRGHMTSHMVGQVIGQLEAEVQAEILAKFKIDEKGLYYNVRLEAEVNKRKGFVVSRNNNLSGKNQYSKEAGHMGGHVTSHMEDENVNVNSNDDKIKKGVEIEKMKTWRNDFETYLEECKKAFRSFHDDKEKMNEQQRLNPGINIKLSIEKGFINFWGTDAGWNHKKKSKSKTIDWRSTIVNSISMNKVYLPKPEKVNGTSVPYAGKTITNQNPH